MKSLVQKLQLLGSETGKPCVTISFNTHRTHPDNEQDRIVLKKLIREAISRVEDQYGKRPAKALLDNLESISEEIDINYNLDSLHLFISDQTKEIIRTTWAVQQDEVYVGEHFVVRPLIKATNRLSDYYVLVLSAGGVQLYEALNEHIIDEIKNQDFPFKSNPHYITHADKASDSKQVDNMVLEFFNKVDKAVIRVQKETGLDVVVLATAENFSHLKQVADIKAIYVAHSPINYNETSTHHIGNQAWEVIKELQHEKRSAALAELKEAVGEGKVLTDIQEIYQATLDGRGDLLVVNQDFSLPVKFTGTRTFDLADDPSALGVEKDIISPLSWNVLSKGGRIVYTRQEELDDLGKIALKVRY